MPGQASRENGKKGGRPKGKVTLEKEILREEVRAAIAPHVAVMIAAQVEHAVGIKHLLMREPKTGKFERVAVDTADPAVAAAQIDAALGTGNAFWIFTKDPSTQAFTDLMNRLIDKPKEQPQEVDVKGKLVMTLEDLVVGSNDLQVRDKK